MNKLRKVFGVADKSVSRTLIGEALAEDYDYQFAVSGQKCLEVVTDFKPHVIVLDIVLPGLRNAEIIRLLRWNSGLKQIRIILLADCAGEMEQFRDNTPGPDDFLGKPFDAEVLRNRVCEQLHIQSLEERNLLQSEELDRLSTRTESPIGEIIQIAQSLGIYRSLPEEELKRAGSTVRRAAEELSALINNARNIVAFREPEKP